MHNVARILARVLASALIKCIPSSATTQPPPALDHPCNPPTLLQSGLCLFDANKSLANVTRDSAASFSGSHRVFEIDWESGINRM